MLSVAVISAAARNTGNIIPRIKAHYDFNNQKRAASDSVKSRRRSYATDEYNRRLRSFDRRRTTTGRKYDRQRFFDHY